MKIRIQYAGAAEMHVHFDDMAHPHEMEAAGPHMGHVARAVPQCVVTATGFAVDTSGRHSMRIEYKTSRVALGEMDHFKAHRHALHGRLKGAGHDVSLQDEPTPPPADTAPLDVPPEPSAPLPSSPDTAILKVPHQTKVS
jgi:hypothetical protein